MSLKRTLRSSTRTSLPPSTGLPVVNKNLPALLTSPSKAATKRVEHANDNVADSTFVDPLSTPPSKRTKTTPAARAPSTPSTVLARGSLNGSTSPTSEVFQKPRPAEPHGTNATLKTPGGSVGLFGALSSYFRLFLELPLQRHVL